MPNRFLATIWLCFVSLAAALASGLALSAPLAGAQDTQGVASVENAQTDPAGPHEAAGDWISLFDGENLGCWTDGEEAGSIVPTVKDGCIVLGMGSMSSGIKFDQGKADKPFPKTNYEIEYIAKRQSGNDFFAALTFPFGDSCCTVVNGGWGGTLFGLSNIDNMDASENNSSSYFNFKNKTWYVFRVRVTDHTISVWLDDEKKIDINTEGHEISIRLEMNRYKPFGFASWVTEGWIRSIRYRHLSEDEINDINTEAETKRTTKRKFTF